LACVTHQVVLLAAGDSDYRDISALWAYFAAEPDTEVTLALLGDDEQLQLGPFTLHQQVTLARKSEPVVHPETLVVTTGDSGTRERTITAHEHGARIVAVGPALDKVTALDLVGTLYAPTGKLACQIMEATKPPPRDPAELIMDEIRADPIADWSLDTMAEHTGMSVRTLSRRFDSLIATSPGDFVTSVRIELSQRLLSEGDGSIPEVAERSGIGSPDTLRHHYQKRLGMSPGAYRRLAATSDAPEERPCSTP
jgi:AraC-like DNA-binding protein